MGKILITGASGLIGKRLTEMLLSAGLEVVHLGRGRKDGPVTSFQWSIEKAYVEPDALEGVDTIIHLAGAGIADKPWSEQRKREILESRTHSTRLLLRELRKGTNEVKNVISASAIGFYGFEDNNHVFTEHDKPGTDFLAQVVRKWEDEVDEFSSLGLRVVKIRIGIVLSPEGGALKELVKPVRFYAGAPLGSGEQQISWIHIDDLCGMFLKAVNDPEMSGPYNGVGPYPVSNREFTQAIARTLKRSLFLPAVPSFFLRLLLGEMADLVLKGNRVSADKIRSAGFVYRFPTLEAALRDLLA